MTSNTEVPQLAALASARAVLSTSTRLLRSVGYPDAADRAIRQATDVGHAPVVVFLGESGRGKTSLVNLLAPDLAGRDADAAGEALYRLVTPDTAGGKGLLGDAVLLDAPSPGGLDAPQSQLNLKFLEAASLAVFVTDAGAQLSSGELAYLEQCSAQVESLGIVITKTDLFPGSWQNVAAGNAALLRARIPRLADTFVLGVSPVTAAAAATATDPAVRDQLLAASGLSRFVEALKTELAHAGLAPTANALRLARTALDGYRRARLTQLAVAGAPAETRAGMLAERQRFSELKEEQQRWALDLERDLGELRAGVLRSAAAAFDDWISLWRNRIQAARGLRDQKKMRQLSSDMIAELLALRADLIAEAEERLAILTHGFFREVPLPAVLNELLSAAGAPADQPHLGSERRGAGFDPTVVMSVVMGSSIGTSIAGLLGVAVSGAAVPLAVAGAGGWFAFNRYYRQNVLERTRLQAEVPRLAQLERAVIADYLDARVRRLKPELVVTYRTQLQASLGGLQQLIQESQAQERLSAEESQRRIEELQREVATIDKQVAEIDESLAHLHHL
ncbi:hypothetical protein [Pseudarthrobacter sp. ATCC 49987]|uniref:hypothetical protein n=1 Tax=Pseudarthrobacter sp. ATCC 49987 TaxID=2698204 RepID=UPI0013689F6E|nr:hypothetical protein [Pseudarthrobacter sp. ATCC 49987]